MGAGFIETADVEGTAAALYRQAGFDLDAQARPVELAERLLGPGSVRLVHSGALPGVAALARWGGQWRIAVRSTAPAIQRRFAVLHELGHWALGTDATEEHCDLLAAALLMPCRAYRRAAGELGPDWPALAACFGCSESAASLRWGEVIGDPLALVAPTQVRIRGAEWGWPPERSVRAIVGNPQALGLRGARLKDDPRRVVLKAA